jgi:uncharacterized protein YjiS (DUF1127 family)
MRTISHTPSQGYHLPTLQLWSLLARYRAALQKRRERIRAKMELRGFSDRELQDMGITRGEIEYVVTNESSDVRCARGNFGPP